MKLVFRWRRNRRAVMFDLSHTSESSSRNPDLVAESSRLGEFYTLRSHSQSVTVPALNVASITVLWL